MFENVLNQDAADQIIKDLEIGLLAPSMIFSGPACSGKGTAALELARVLSCQTPGAPWNCECRDCKQHRLLVHPDLILMGSRIFSAEISAASDTFLRNQGNSAARLLLIRAVQKLLARFNPVLWEDDSKIDKLNDTIVKLTEDLDDLQRFSLSGEKDNPIIVKLVESIDARSFKLENDGISEIIPVGQIRRASAWSRLAPSGKRKVLIIEQADRMQDASSNSLLKILEEPPDNLSIILTTSYPGAILPTLLSRLRPYRFSQRDGKTESEVIRRVFRSGDPEAVSGGSNRIMAYLDSFLPSRGDELYPWAAYFAASVAASAVIQLRRNGIGEIPGYILSLGKYSAPIAEAHGPGRPSTDTKTIVSAVVKGGNNFEIRSLFSVFLKYQLEIISGAVREDGGSPGVTCLASVWGKKVKEAEVGVSTFNQTPGAALERLFIELKETLSSGLIRD